MRRITWILLSITVLLWVSIAIFWTGTVSNNSITTKPILGVPLSPETPTSTPTPTLIEKVSTSSAASPVSLAPATPTAKPISPTSGVDLKY